MEMLLDLFSLVLKNRFIFIDIVSIPLILFEYVKFAESYNALGTDICTLNKSCKNRIEQEVSLYNQLYTTLSDQLEIAKINEKDSTSTVFLLDSPHIVSYKAGQGFLESIITLLISIFVLLLFFEAYNKREQLFILKD